MLLFSSNRSNFAGRVRYVIYFYGLEDQIQIRSPSESEGAVGGGATSLPADLVASDDAYMTEVRSYNPIGKIPLLVINQRDRTSLFESQIIAEYLDDVYGGDRVRLIPSDPLEKAKVRLVCRLHDVYMGSHFLPILFRREKMTTEQFTEGQKWLIKTLDTLETLRQLNQEKVAAYSYFWGYPSLADAALAPSIVYMILCEAQLGPGGLFTHRPFLNQWWKFLLERDRIWQRVYKEMWDIKHDLFSGRV